MERKYTLLPDPSDERDLVFASKPKPLPAEVDLRPKLSPVVDQGSLGSCTANAIGSGLREYLHLRDHGMSAAIALSRLYLYWHERELIGTIGEDSGAYIRDGMKILQKLGCAPEADFPYDVSKFTDKPSDKAEADAAAFKIFEYHRILNFNTLQHALADGLPVVLGIKIYQSFESFNASMSGMIPVPDTTKEQFLGGHAVLAVGYKTFNDGQVYILVRNSWGSNWGQFGYCYIPQEFFDKGFVTDMWTGNTTAKKPKIAPEDLSFKDAIDIAVKRGIFDTPEFWAGFEARYQAGQLTNADFEYVFLGFRKFAADAENNAPE